MVVCSTKFTTLNAVGEEEYTKEYGRGVEKYTFVFGFNSEEDLMSELKDKQVLDAGSGAGNLKKDLGDEYNVTNLDIRHIPDSKSVQAMGEFMPFKDETFDTILCNHSLFYYGQDTEDVPLENVIDMQGKEVFRVLKPGGRLHVILLPNNRNYENVPNEDSKFIVYTSVDRKNGNEYTSFPVLKILKEIGFDIDKAENFITVHDDGYKHVQTRAVLNKPEESK